MRQERGILGSGDQLCARDAAEDRGGNADHERSQHGQRRMAVDLGVQRDTIQSMNMTEGLTEPSFCHSRTH